MSGAAAVVEVLRPQLQDPHLSWREVTGRLTPSLASLTEQPCAATPAGVLGVTSGQDSKIVFGGHSLPTLQPPRTPEPLRYRLDPSPALSRPWLIPVGLNRQRTRTRRNLDVPKTVMKGYSPFLCDVGLHPDLKSDQPSNGLAEQDKRQSGGCSAVTRSRLHQCRERLTVGICLLPSGTEHRKLIAFTPTPTALTKGLLHHSLGVAL